MAKEWILNSAMNRFQLNFKRNVGATSESIRKCSPKTLHEEYTLQAETHKKFTEVFGGKVFYLFSAKVGERKEIQNTEVIDEIRQEIERLK